MRIGLGTGSALVVALALAGCGGKGADGNAATAEAGDAPAAAVASADPCSFITAAEVTAITTDKVNEAKRDGDHDCKYSSDPSDDGISLTVWQSDGKHQMEITHKVSDVLGGIGASVADKGGAAADAAEMMKKDGTAAPKLGDEAVWGMNTTLSVRKGDAFVQVTPPIMHDPANHSGYPLLGQDEKRAIAQKVAEKVLAKL